MKNTFFHENDTMSEMLRGWFYLLATLEENVNLIKQQASLLRITHFVLVCLPLCFKLMVISVPTLANVSKLYLSNCSLTI